MRKNCYNLILSSVLVLLGILSFSCHGTSYDFDTKPHSGQKPQEAPATGTRVTKPSGALLFTTETHEVIKDNKLDILLVVDNSESMADIRSTLRSKLDLLISSVDNTDWSVGISSTDIKTTCIEALVKKDDPDRSNKFNQAIDALQQTFSQEQHDISKIALALSCSNELTGGKSWIREGSSVAVVIISDKDSLAKTYQDPNSQMLLSSDEYLLKQLNNIRTIKEGLRVYGIINIPNSSSCSKREQTNPGVIYSQLIHKTGGVEGSVCGSSIDSTLQVISSNISQSLTKHYKLKNTPVSLQVFLDNTELKTGFTHSENSVRLPRIDSGVEKIRFEYFYRP